MTFQSMPVPRITQEDYDLIAQKCRVEEIVPETARDRWMYEAGQQKVLEYIKAGIGRMPEHANRTTTA